LAFAEKNIVGEGVIRKEGVNGESSVVSASLFLLLKKNKSALAK
jgi:hypothetical protein